MHHSLYIDTHTHHQERNKETFQLKNVIIGKESLPTLPCSVGIHPWYIIGSDIKKQFILMKDYLNRENVLAVGECGLDKLCKTDWEIQTSVFQRQIDIAENVEKPLIIHCVRAYQEVLQLLRKTTQPVIFHGFNKNIELVCQLLKQGYYISLGADILHGHLDEHIREIPLNKIFLETDDKPIPIIDIYAYFCTVRKINLPQLKEQIGENFERVFKYVIK